jgi:hypothetical protein
MGTRPLRRSRVLWLTSQRTDGARSGMNRCEMAALTSVPAATIVSTTNRDV